jgi:type I restriction enzyme S subunit
VTEVKEKNTGGREDNLLSLSYGNIVRRDIATADGLLPESFDSYNVINPGDTVLRLTDLQNDQRSLRVGLVEEVGIITSAYVTIRPSKVFHPKFLNYFLKHMDFRKDFYALGAGVRQSLKFEELRLVKVPIPALADQKAIAEYLDRETAHIDVLITAKQNMMKLVDEFFMSEIATVCDELPNLVPIKRVAETAYGLGQPPTLSEPSSETVPIIRATNINRGAIESVDLIHALREDLPLGRAPLLKEGEILVVRSGALTGDSVRIVGEWVGSAPGYDLRVTPTAIDSRLLAWQLLGPGVRVQLDLVRMRAAQPHLNAEDLGSVMVRAGSHDAEAKVADLLDVAVARSWRLVASIRAQIDLLRERRQALITAAVTGDLKIMEVAA